MACGCQCLAEAAVSLKILSSKRGIPVILAKMNLELFPLFVCIYLCIVNIYFEFQIYMFSNGGDMTTYQQFLYNNDAAKAIAIPSVSSENSRAKNHCPFEFQLGTRILEKMLLKS